jgi:hypothetical protein
VSPAKGNGTQPFDLEAAAKAAAAEAGEQPFPFAYKGGQYQVPAATLWPVAALAELAAGELAGALGVLLGEKVYHRLVAAGLTVGELNTLFAAVGAGAGFPSLPNSPPPAPPSSTPP